VHDKVGGDVAMQAVAHVAAGEAVWVQVVQSPGHQYIWAAVSYFTGFIIHQDH
jgi:hypothetical protein